jgi:hypothetical protein
MTNGQSRPSLSTIRDAVRSVRDQVKVAQLEAVDEPGRQQALMFLDALDNMVKVFCLRLTDGNETLDPIPRRKP